MANGEGRAPVRHRVQLRDERIAVREVVAIAGILLAALVAFVLAQAL